MDANSIASYASSNAATQTAQAASLLTLKKANQIQQQTATELLAALPQPVSSNPPNLGTVIDTRA